MTFSIIIINYKTAKITADCLQSLLKLAPPTLKEIILIDNASSDGGLELLSTEFKDKIIIIANDKNLGFAAANNQGSLKASGDLLLFLNSDTIINENIFDSCVNIFKNHPEIGIISPLLKTESGDIQENYYGDFPVLSKLIFKNRFKTGTKQESATSYFISDWVSGCALIIRRELFEKLGGWDDNFFLYFEDVDICKRAQEYNYQTAVSQQTSLIHLGGKSLTLNSQRKKYYYHAQNYYFRKHYGRFTEILMRIVRWPLKIVKS